MNLSEHTIVVARVDYADGTGSKVRPAFVVELDGEVVKTYRITSQYANKSEYIKKKYFEIVDYVQAGLRRQSWIDFVQPYFVDKNKTKIKILGRLSLKDEQRLDKFLENL